MRSSSRSRETSRREWLRLATTGVVGWSMSGWLGGARANRRAAEDRQRKSCVLLWMNGGASQIDTFDPKPGHANGGPFKAITTKEGIQISEHLPKIANFMDRMAIIRTMNTGPGQNADHAQEVYQMHTGRQIRVGDHFPSIGSMVAESMGTDQAGLPNYISVAPYRRPEAEAHGAGFLGPRYAPLVVAEAKNYDQKEGTDFEKLLKVQDVKHFQDIARERFDARVNLLRDFEKDFVAQRPGLVSKSHQIAIERAVKLMHATAASAFDLQEESAKVRDSYGRNLFGQGCLLARRLIERGVPFVEVASGLFFDDGQWDTHANGFETIKKLCIELDAGWSSLMQDLQDRGLLDSTLIVWASEFGRSPKINNSGREHWASGWSTVLAGGGIKGGQVIGSTGKDGSSIEGRAVTAPDFVATVSKALGMDPKKPISPTGERLFRITDPTAEPVAEILP